MKIDYTKSFIKQYKKLSPKTQDQFKQKLKIFDKNNHHPSLNNHALRGKHQGFYSINVNGDVRALYTKNGGTIMIFGFIGTHSQLYG